MGDLELVGVTVWLLTYLVQLEAVQLSYSHIFLTLVRSEISFPPYHPPFLNRQRKAGRSFPAFANRF